MSSINNLRPPPSSSSILGKRPCPTQISIFTKSKNPKEFKFTKANLVYKVILIFKGNAENIACDEGCNKYSTRYVCIEKHIESKTRCIRVFHSACLQKNVIPPERKSEFSSLLSTTKKRAGIFRLWYFANIISKNELVDDREKLNTLFYNMTTVMPSESLAELTKNINTIAQPQLIIQAHKKNIISFDETLFYLQTAFKKAISPNDISAIVKTNKVILDNSIIAPNPDTTTDSPQNNIVIPIPLRPENLDYGKPENPISPFSALNFYLSSNSYIKILNERTVP